MLYYVKVKNTIVFKGNFYACREFIDSFKNNAWKLKLSTRK